MSSKPEVRPPPAQTRSTISDCAVDIPEAASVEQNKVAMRAIVTTATVDYVSLIGRQFDDHFRMTALRAFGPKWLTDHRHQAM